TVEVVSVKARIATVARMERIRQAGQNEQQRDKGRKREDVVYCTDTGTLLLLGKRAAQHEVGKINQQANGRAVLFRVVAPVLTPRKLGPFHTCYDAQHTEEYTYFSSFMRDDVVFDTRLAQV